MASGRYGAVVGSVHRLFDGGTLVGMGEGELLRRFATRRDPAAFEGLVARHGPMVLGVCRRILGDAHDVDDAFQATFLILVKKAGSLRDPDLLGPWLHGVAHRVAVRARANAARRRSKEMPGAEETAMVAASDDFSSDRQEMRAVLDEEIARLPERFRRPVVLCYLEGLTHDEAAARLKCPVGTVRSRMSTARTKLRDRLSRRGVTLPATLFGATLAAEAASAAVPQVLIDATVSAAVAYAAQGAGATMAGTVSAGAASLAEGVTNTMFVQTLKLGGAVVLTAILTVGGAGAVAWHAGPGEGKAQDPVAKPADEPAKKAESTREEFDARRESLIQKADELQSQVTRLTIELAEERQRTKILEQTVATMRGKATNPVQIALIGKMDVDGNASDDRELVKKKIQNTGGFVAYDLPPRGTAPETGKITPLISVYVQDDSIPSAEDKPVMDKAVKEARENGVRPISLKSLMRSLGNREQEADDEASALLLKVQRDRDAAKDKAAADFQKRIEDLQRTIRELADEKELMRQRHQKEIEEAVSVHLAVNQHPTAKAGPEVEKAKANRAGDKEAVDRKKRIEELQRKLDELNAVLNPINEELQLKQQIDQLENQIENAKAQLAPKDEAKDAAQGSGRGIAGGMGGMGGGGYGGGMGGGFRGPGGGMGGGGYTGGGLGGRGAVVGKNQGKKPSAVTLENGACILVQKPDAEKISAYSVAKGEWSTYAIPKGVKLTPLMANSLVLFHAKGEEVRQIVAYVPQLSKWTTIELKEPTREAVPIIADNVGAIAIGRRVYAFSLVANKWDVAELEEGAKPVPVVWPNRVIVEFKDDLYVFSADTGKWSHYDDKNPAVVTPSGNVVTPPKD